LEAENVVQVSFVISEKIVKYLKSYSDGEFVKERFVAFVEILCPSNSNSMHNIGVSHHAVTWLF
jgi:hypothetical protein